MGAVNAACPPGAAQVQSVQARQQSDAVKALGVMAEMATGKVSASDGMKQLQSLVEDSAKAQASLAPGGGTGFSTKDTFEAGGASKPKVALSPAAAPVTTSAQDTSFLAQNSGGGSKPGIASGSN